MPSQIPPQPPLRFDATPSSIGEEANRLISTCRAAHDTIVNSITPDTATFATVLLPFAHAENAHLSGKRALDIYTLLSADPALREASRKAEDLLGAFNIEIKQRADLFVLIDAVVNKGEVLDPEDEHFLKTVHREMIKTGISLPDEKRARFAEIQKQILELGSKFAEHVRAPSKPGVWFTREELARMPVDVLDGMEVGSSATGENEGKVCAKMGEDYMPVLRFAEDAEVRKRMYVGYMNRCNENVSIFKEVALLRDEAARMLGYRNHAELMCEDRMARAPETVRALLGRLREGLVKGGDGAMERYRREKQRDFEERGVGWDGRVYVWDLNYYGRRATSREAKEKETEWNLKDIEEWFPLEVMVAEMLETMGRLFGLVFTEMKFEEEEEEEEEEEREKMVWRDDVQVFSVWNSEDEGGDFLGYLYLDLYSHEFKGSGKWCTSLVPGHTKPDGSRMFTSVALVCDFDRPTSTKPCLLGHFDVTLMFHELGHGIHDLVSRTRYGRFHGCAGTVIDFGEAPSQVLENWFLIPSELKRFSRHYSSLSDNYLKIWKEKKAAALRDAGLSMEEEEIAPPPVHLPDEMITDFLRSKGRERVLVELGQLAISTWDFMVHDQESHEALEELNFPESYNHLYRELYPVADLSDLGGGFEWRHPYCGWTMLVQGDYHAGYYSYALSEVYAADIFDTFFRADPTNVTQGRKYRYGLLEPGGRRPEMETLLSFLGRKPNPEPFLRSLGIS